MGDTIIKVVHPVIQFYRLVPIVDGGLVRETVVTRRLSGVFPVVAIAERNFQLLFRQVIKIIIGCEGGR